MLRILSHIRFSGTEVVTALLAVFDLSLDVRAKDFEFPTMRVTKITDFFKVNAEDLRLALFRLHQHKAAPTLFPHFSLACSAGSFSQRVL